MNLKELRSQFLEMSGRYDLVNDDLSDAGVDFYINEAIRWLDRKADINRAWATIVIPLTAGDWYKTMPVARAINVVKLNGRQLCPMAPADMVSSLLESGVQLGTPQAHCCINSNVGDQEFAPEELNDFIAALGAIPDTAVDLNTLIFCRAMDKPGVLTITGLFYQQPLVKDIDTNFWSISQPILLLKATIRQTLVVTGNQALLTIADQDIERDLLTFSQDRVEENLYGSGQMRG